MLTAMVAFVVTLAITYFTIWYLAINLFQFVFASFQTPDFKDLLINVFFGLVVFALWAGWWVIIGSRLTIGLI